MANDSTSSAANDRTDDPKVLADWAAVEAHRADLNSGEGGNTRRQAILRRLNLLKEAS